MQTNIEMLKTKHQLLKELYSSSSGAWICKSFPGIIKYIVNELVKGGAGAMPGIAELLKPVPLSQEQSSLVTKQPVLLWTKIAFEHLSQELPNSFLTHQRAKKPHLSHLPDLKWIQSNKVDSPASIPACNTFTLSGKCSSSLPTVLLLSLKFDSRKLSTSVMDTFA